MQELHRVRDIVAAFNGSVSIGEIVSNFWPCEIRYDEKGEMCVTDAGLKRVVSQTKGDQNIDKARGMYEIDRLMCRLST